MQRRLTLAIVGMALAAVVLVGVGVLLLAQFGARQDAAREVEGQLDALSDVIDNVADSERVDTNVRRLADAFDIERIELVLVDEQGQVLTLQRSPRPTVQGLELDADQVAALQRDENVVVDHESAVVGLRQINVRGTPRFQRRGLTQTLLVQQEVGAIGRQARAWFLVSAIAVLTLSAVVAGWLSRRFTRPIRQIEAATAQIAAGELDTRVDIAGDDELSDLGRAVNRMAADLQRSRSSEQEFLMSISHDLRTPLTSISGYAEALADDATPDTRAAGQVIVDNAGRLNRLVADLLDLARLTSREFRLHLEPTEAGAVVSAAVEGHRLAADASGIELLGDFESGLEIAADGDRLAQAVGNLIDNALKFATSTVRVGVTSEENQVIIAVEDDGPGILPEDVPYVFERLYVTKQQPRRAENSSGLGLAIVRQLAEAMGGRVEASPAPGGGTRMTLSFPSA